MFDQVIMLGGFAIWLLKGCKTNLDEEIWGKNGTYMGSNDLRNLIVGYIVVGIFLGLLYLYLSHKY